jgi:hypothetical protein
MQIVPWNKSALNPIGDLVVRVTDVSPRLQITRSCFFFWHARVVTHKHAKMNQPASTCTSKLYLRLCLLLHPPRPPTLYRPRCIQTTGHDSYDSFVQQPDNLFAKQTAAEIRKSWDTNLGKTSDQNDIFTDQKSFKRIIETQDQQELVSPSAHKVRVRARAPVRPCVYAH